jgi:photosystem II stability/assembly factor-like uncharacterized protein
MPPTLYAGVTVFPVGGAFTSTDGGAHWGAGLTDRNVSSLAIDPVVPATVYAGTDGGVFKSTDGGAHWIGASTGLTDLNVSALAIGPSSSTTLYAVASARIFTSTDGGGHWAAVNTTDLPEVYSLAIDALAPTTLYARTFSVTPYEGTVFGTGVFKSTDGGLHWVAVNTGLTDLNVSSLAIDPVAPTTL